MKRIRVKNGSAIKAITGRRIPRTTGKPQGHTYIEQRRSLQELRLKWSVATT